LLLWWVFEVLITDLFISEQGASLHKSGETILLKKDSQLLFEMELKNLKSVQVFGNIQISTQLLGELLERGIELAYYQTNGELLGQLTPIHVKNVELRYKQYLLVANKEFNLEFSKEILRQKFLSSIYVLEEGNRNRDNLNLKSEILNLKSYFEKLSSASSIESLLGIEGSFAKLYYQNMGLLFSDISLFTSRSKRPPKDEANSLLSFTYTLVTNRISSYIDGLGFDPYLGFYHRMEYGRVSLACDIIEMIRPLFCDRLVLSLFNLQIITRKDFDWTEQGIRLSYEGRKKFISKYAEELNKSKNYRITKGNFTDFMDRIIQWLRICFEEEKIQPLNER
jgi:CRISPR-associated protein Cas1